MKMPANAIRHVRRFASEAMQPTSGRKHRRSGSAQRLLATGRDVDNWLMYGRDYANLRFSPLKQINKDNVRNLVPVWSFQTGVPDGLQATPLFVDGVIYLSTSWNHAFAIDARTGAELWHYKRRLPEKMVFAVGRQPRTGNREWNPLHGDSDAHLSLWSRIREEFVGT